MKAVKAKRIKAVSTGIEGSDDNRYWKPQEVGQSIEGVVDAITQGDYGQEVRLVVEVGDNEELVKLPAHADLKNKMEDVFEGDYLYVTLSDIKKSNNDKYADKMIYTVEYVQAQDIPQV